MAGWVFFSGKTQNFGTRIARFVRIFSVEGVPELKLAVHDSIPTAKLILWAWNKEGIPDVRLKKSSYTVLVLHGVITGVGDSDYHLSNSDDAAEEVLNLWRKQGEKAIRKLNGSFSCLFFDEVTQSISVFADRFASRSVWYASEKGDYFFSNMPTAITALMKNAPSLDHAGLWSLFHAGRPVGNHSLYSNIHSLMAGQKVELSPTKEMEITHWWKRRYEPLTGRSPSDWGNELAYKLTVAASRYKNTSKSPYLYLSGGLDSRIVASALKKPLRTISLCNKPNAESHIAHLVSRILGLKHQTLKRSLYWYLDTMKASSLVSAGNNFNQHTHFIVPTARVSTADPDAEFILGDLIENLSKHYMSRPVDSNFNFTPENIKNILFSFSPYVITERKNIGKYFNKELRESLEENYSIVLMDFAQSLMDVSENHTDIFDTFFRWANVALTPTYNMITCIRPLAKERNIFFDNDLNQLSMQIPSFIRGKGILHKWILYHLSKRLLLIPDANTFMPPIVPRNFNEKAKKMRPAIGKLRRRLFRNKAKDAQLVTSGSWLFLHEVYRKNDRYREYIDNLINDNQVFPPDIFDIKEIKKIWQQFLAGDINRYFEIEALVSFGVLNKMFPCSGFS